MAFSLKSLCIRKEYVTLHQESPSVEHKNAVLLLFCYPSLVTMGFLFSFFVL
nr:MAG TPA: hypothetical protein [Caudoviricetes sp.]